MLSLCINCFADSIVCLFIKWILIQANGEMFWKLFFMWLFHCFPFLRSTTDFNHNGTVNGENSLSLSSVHCVLLFVSFLNCGIMFAIITHTNTEMSERKKCHAIRETVFEIQIIEQRMKVWKSLSLSLSFLRFCENYLRLTTTARSSLCRCRDHHYQNWCLTLTKRF
jgi:hypothetical protein